MTVPAVVGNSMDQAGFGHRAGPDVPRSAPGSMALALGLYLLVSVQGISLLTIGETSVKLFHIGVLLLLVPALTNPRVSDSLRPLVTYLYFALLISPVGYLVFGFSAVYLNYLFCAAVCIVLGTLFVNANYEHALKGLQIAAVVIVLYTIANVALNYDGVRAAQALSVATGARPTVPYMLYSGGVNIDGSWIAIAGAFFIRNRIRFAVYTALSLFIQMSYMTRSGLVVAGFLILLHLILTPRTWRRKVFGVLGAVLSLPLAYMVVYALADSVRVFDRMTHIGEEPGSLERFGMWGYVPEAFGQSPFYGHGAGNDALAIVKASGFMITSDNVHNYVLGNLLAFGVLGPVVFLWAMWHLIKRNRLKSELVAYLLAFGLAALAEFRGGDAVFYCVVAILASCAPCGGTAGPGLDSSPGHDESWSAHKAARGA